MASKHKNGIYIILVIVILLFIYLISLPKEKENFLIDSLKEKLSVLDRGFNNLDIREGTIRIHSRRELSPNGQTGCATGPEEPDWHLYSLHRIELPWGFGRKAPCSRFRICRIRNPARSR